MASIEEFFLFVLLGGGDGAVELGVDFGGHGLEGFVKVFGPVVLVEVELGESLACVLEFVANFADGVHVGFHLNAEALAEDIDKLDGGSGRTATEPPDVSVDDVHALDDGCKHGSEAVARGAVCVEVDGNLHGCLEFRHQGVDARRGYQAGHVFYGNHLGAEAFHLFGFLNEVFVGEDFLLFGCAFGVDGIADGGVGDTTELVDEADGFLDVVDVVEGVEDTHHVEAVLDGFAVETFEHEVGIRHVAEEVTAA